jgi:hypothetical protein
LRRYCADFQVACVAKNSESRTHRSLIKDGPARWNEMLPKDKRLTEEQAKLFAKKATERIPSSGDPYRQIMGWLLAGIGNA